MKNKLLIISSTAALATVIGIISIVNSLDLASPEKTLKPPINKVAYENTNEGKKVFEKFEQMKKDKMSSAELFNYLKINSTKVDDKTSDYMLLNILELTKNHSKDKLYQEKLNDYIETYDTPAPDKLYEKIFKSFASSFPNECKKKDDIAQMIAKDPKLVEKLVDTEVKNIFKEIIEGGYEIKMEYCPLREGYDILSDSNPSWQYIHGYNLQKFTFIVTVNYDLFSQNTRLKSTKTYVSLLKKEFLLQKDWINSMTEDINSNYKKWADDFSNLILSIEKFRTEYKDFININYVNEMYEKNLEEYFMPVLFYNLNATTQDPKTGLPLIYKSITDNAKSNMSKNSKFITICSEFDKALKEYSGSSDFLKSKTIQDIFNKYFKEKDFFATKERVSLENVLGNQPNLEVKFEGFSEMKQKQCYEFSVSDKSEHKFDIYLVDKESGKVYYQTPDGSSDLVEYVKK